MTQLSYIRGMTLPWSSKGNEEQRFRLITAVTLAVALLFGALVPLVDLPEKERFKRTVLPPRLAQLILEQKQKPPPPKPKAVKIPKKKKPTPKKQPEVKKPPEPKPKPKKAPPQQVAKKPVERSPETARKKAAASGLLAFADDLADLREDPGITSVQNVRKLSVTGNRAATSQRSIITSGVSQGSGGINTAQLSRDTGGQGLSGRQTTQVKNAAVRGNGGDTTRPATRKDKDRKGNRTREEIQLVFDKNKGAVYALYNRALRKDPSLRGKVVLELTIAPTGKVTSCKILSSELQDKALERKLVSRVKLFKFPSKDVDIAVVSYPIDFLPS